jgi:hypothetical protein
LRIYGEADIPETEYLFGIGGYDYVKLAASEVGLAVSAIEGGESAPAISGIYGNIC